MRYVFCIVSALLFVTFGFKQCSSSYNMYTQNDRLTAINASLNKDIETNKTTRDRLTDELRAKGITAATSNIEIAEIVSKIASASLVAIDAEYLEDDQYVSIVSAMDVSEVEFFTEDVQYMKFMLTSTDIAKTMRSVNTSSLQVISFEADYESNLVYLRVPTVFMS